MLLSLCKLAYYYVLTYITGAICLFLQLISRLKPLTGIPLQTGKVAIVTGGATGIGFYVSKGLVAKNVHVIIGGKCKKTGKQAIDEIRCDFPNAKVDFIPLDLSSLHSVKQFAEDFLSRNLGLHMLINNAGIMFPDYELTEDGYESQFQVNYLSHFFLTQLLLEKLAQSGKDNSWSRIVNVSSSVHCIGNPDLENLDRKLTHWYEYSSHKAYADSKLMAVTSSHMLDRQLREDGVPVSVCSLHPGVVWTGLWKHVQIWIHRLPLKFFCKLFYTAEQGAVTTLYAAMSPEVEGQSGCYYDNSERCDAARLTYDLDFQSKLWIHSIDLIGAAFTTE